MSSKKPSETAGRAISGSSRGQRRIRPAQLIEADALRMRSDVDDMTRPMMTSPMKGWKTSRLNLTVGHRVRDVRMVAS